MQTELTPMKIYRVRAGVMSRMRHVLIAVLGTAAMALGGVALVQAGTNSSGDTQVGNSLRQGQPSPAVDREHGTEAGDGEAVADQPIADERGDGHE